MPVNGGEVPFERAVLMPLNVGIAHPSGMLAESLASVLVSEPDIQLVWSARDGISVRSLLRGRVCDVLICAQQIEPDGCDGVISYVGDAGLPTSIVVLVDTEIGDQLRDAVSSTGGQAPALVQHFSTVSTLVEAIRAAAAGRTFVDPLLVPELLLRERPHAETLTPRETAVLDELSLGLSNKEIAIALSVTIETVKTHVKNVMRKLEVTNRTAAVLQAAQRSAATAAESYNELAAVVDSGNDAIVTKNPLGLITSWNAGATRMYGYSADEVVGMSRLPFIPEGLIDVENAVLTRVLAGKMVPHYQTVRIAKNGDLLDVSLTMSPVRDVTGQIVGVSTIAREITHSTYADMKQRSHIVELEYHPPRG